MTISEKQNNNSNFHVEVRRLVKICGLNDAYVSGKFFQILIVHVVWNHCCGVESVGVTIGQLSSKSRSDELQVPTEKRDFKK